MVRRTKEEALETRAQLLDAAERVFSEYGVTNTSLNQIAEAAGLTRGAIYWHFKNKYELIEALLQRVTLPLDELGAGHEARHADDPLRRIRANAIAILRRAATDAHLRGVCTILFQKCEHIAEARPVLERHRDSRCQCAAEVEAGFRAAMAAGQLPDSVDPRLATLGLFSYVDGLIYNWLLDPAYFSLADDAERLVDIYLNGLRNPGP